jgi:hypothetical protein
MCQRFTGNYWIQRKLRFLFAFVEVSGLNRFYVEYCWNWLSKPSTYLPGALTASGVRLALRLASSTVFTCNG